MTRPRVPPQEKKASDQVADGNPLHHALDAPAGEVKFRNAIQEKSDGKQNQASFRGMQSDLPAGLASL